MRSPGNVDAENENDNISGSYGSLCLHSQILGWGVGWGAQTPFSLCTHYKTAEITGRLEGRRPPPSAKLG